jgi:hypothetical protein
VINDHAVLAGHATDDGRTVRATLLRRNQYDYGLVYEDCEATINWSTGKPVITSTTEDRRRSRAG